MTEPTALAAMLALAGVDRLAHPDWLPWLAAAACLPLLLARLSAPRALAWPGIGEAIAAGGRRFETASVVATGLRTAALLCLAVVLCDPLSVRPLPPESGLGLDLILVLDTSKSMGARDAMVGDGAAAGYRTRLDLALEAVARFASHRVAEGDRVGLVVFGDSAFTQCPATADADLLLAALGRVRVGMAGESTALGDALALAIKRASADEDETQRLVVLLTDGRSNAGSIPLGIARELARAAAVRVHTVAIGTSGREVAIDAGGTPDFERYDPDHDALRLIANETGGAFFDARRSRDLGSVYAAIDRQERSPRPLPRRRLEQPRPEPLLAAAGSLVIAEILLVRVLRRRLP